MDSTFLIAPMMMSYMMTTAPMALLVSGGEIDRERIARGVAQLSVMTMRSVMDVTYDDLVFDDRTGDFSVRGLEVTLPDEAGLPGCSFKIDAVTIVALDRPDTLSFASESDGIVVNPACAGPQGAIVQSMLGPDAMNVTHYSATTSYHIGQSSLDHSMLVETAAAGSVSMNTRLEGLHFKMGRYGDPLPAGEVAEVEVTIQDTDALRALLPVLGLDADPVAMATGAMGGILSEGGITDPERALIDSANAELGRVVENGGAVTLRSGAGVSVSFEQLMETNGPEDLVTLLQPVFSSALAGADNLISSDLLKKAISSPDDLSPEDQLRVAEALASGEGAPQSVEVAAALLKPLAESGNSKAALHFANLLHSQGSVDDPVADVAKLRLEARQFANGRGAPRNYGQALLLASLAAAGGDHSSQLLIERLSERFAGDDADVWNALKAEQAKKALSLWADGFGDGFSAQ